MLANLAIKIWNTNLQSSFYISSYLRKFFVEILAICSFCEGVIFWWWEPFKIHFIFFHFLFFHFLAIFCQFKNKAANHCNNGLLPTSSAFLCWRLKDNTQIILQKGQWLGGLARVVLPHFFKKKRNFAFLTINYFLGNFGWTSFSTVISTNFAIQGENFTQNFDITNMKIKTLWITNLFSFSPVPKAKITHNKIGSKAVKLFDFWWIFSIVAGKKENWRIF